MLTLKRMDWSGIYHKVRHKVRLPDAHKAKLKGFATSNGGITAIVLFVVVLFLGINLLRHHHARAALTPPQSGWNAPVSSKTPAVSNPALPPTTAKATLPATASAAVSSGQMKNMMHTLTEVSDQMKSLNQRMMVISEQLAHPSHPVAVNRPYRILGWRLDQDTNQWVADIEYNGQVKAYYAGQHVGQWVVRDVTADGVNMR